MTLRTITFKKAKILIVDDNEDNLELASQILEDDYEVVTGRSGSDCLHKARDLKPDVIVLDVQMPDMDGYETLAKLRSTAEGKEIPVIFLSARYRDSDRVIKGLEMGALDYITKPVDDDLLMAKVRVGVRIKQAEDAVREKAHALEVANKEMEAFTYSVSHDLRAPLRALDGFSAILSEDYAESLDEEGLQYLARIRAGSQKMGSLIDDLLDFARTSRGDLAQSPLDVSAMVNDVCTEIQATEDHAQLSITVQSGMTTLGDSKMIRVVLMNLISNAIKYSSKEDKPCLEIYAEKSATREVFTIKDNGVGFEMRYVDQLFHPFRRLHSSDEFPGNGIGLATVHRIIQRHGGTIWAESEVGKGSVFNFTLTDMQQKNGYSSQNEGI
ncbi:MAG: response regulator [Ghiorsea sp.]